MVDFRGRTISVGDAVVVLHSGGTNSTLVYGRVVEEYGGYVKYEVLLGGRTSSYIGHPEPSQIRSCYSPHKIAICNED